MVMRKITILSAFAVAILATSCKTNKIASATTPVSEESVQPAATAPTVTTPTYQSNNYPSSTVGIREEKFEIVETTNQGDMNYYIIVGSFKSYDNATRFKTSLMNDGYYPSILKNESGLFRVSIESYIGESDARAKMANIRQNQSKFGDSWLLIQKR